MRRFAMPAASWLGWLVWGGTVLAAPATPDFETQVLPVLTKAGCNSGACHGAAIGRGGFRLSLLGYDPEADYESLIHEFKGRRVNLAFPEKSLVLKKPSRQLPHEGGRRLPADGEGHRLILDWIKAGAPRAPSRSLLAIEVSPTDKSLTAVEQAFAIHVTARFSDGVREDVTRWAVFTPTDSAAVCCTLAGDVSVLRRGQHAIMVRFLGEVGCVTVTVPLVDDPLPKGDRPRANFIDEHVNRLLDRLRLPQAPRADDAVLVRRVYLDLIGTLPEPKEVEAFLTDKDADKLAKLVERLLARPEFVDFWAYKWGDLLRIDSQKLQPKNAAAFHQWIHDRVAQNAPLDRLARELLLALGDASQVGPANFHRVPGDAGAEAEYVSQVFLGVRLQCANCHNHPLDRWTQDDYHGLAAVFARLSRGQEVQLQARGEVTHPKTGKAALPRIPGQEFLDARDEPRERFARWLTEPANPYFARAAINRLWRELLGRGLVEPIDDLRATNPATHPELLEALARDFVEHRFDIRHAIRTIVASEAYRRSSLGSGAGLTDDRFYSRALIRPLPPGVMVDAVARVTGVPEPLGAAPGQRAIALLDARVASVPLDLLGRCSRAGVCSQPSARSGSLPLALHKINGPWLNAKIGHPQGRLYELLQAKLPDEAIVTALYETALCRKPSTGELAHWKGKLAADNAGERARGFEDFLWALLNSVEFSCNH